MMIIRLQVRNSADGQTKESSMTVVSVIVGSTRAGRFSKKPAHWIWKHLDKGDGVDARLLDLRDLPMPCFDQPATPATPGHLAFEHEVVRRWTAIHVSERWAGAAVDYLETREDVDRGRIGMMGWSLSGYYAPRAACYEKRFKLCVAWAPITIGANCSVAAWRGRATDRCRTIGIT